MAPGEEENAKAPMEPPRKKLAGVARRLRTDGFDSHLTPPYLIRLALLSLTDRIDDDLFDHCCRKRRGRVPFSDRL